MPEQGNEQKILTILIRNIKWKNELKRYHVAKTFGGVMKHLVIQIYEKEVMVTQQKNEKSSPLIM